MNIFKAASLEEVARRPKPPLTMPTGVGYGISTLLEVLPDIRRLERETHRLFRIPCYYFGADFGRGSSKTAVECNLVA